MSDGDYPGFTAPDRRGERKPTRRSIRPRQKQRSRNMAAATKPCLPMPLG